jgi:hypothetical protein
MPILKQQNAYFNVLLIFMLIKQNEPVFLNVLKKAFIGRIQQINASQVAIINSMNMLIILQDFVLKDALKIHGQIQ